MSPSALADFEANCAKTERHKIVLGLLEMALKELEDAIANGKVENNSDLLRSIAKKIEDGDI